MNLKRHIILAIFSAFLLTSCLTSTVKVDSLPDEEYKIEYENAKSEKELQFIQAQYIIELKRVIYKLWTNILKSDEKYIKIIDLRRESDKKKYEKFIKENK